MDNWVLKGVRNLSNEHWETAEISPTQVKVKITHLLISNFDAMLFNGDIAAKYPKTLGRFAVGIVTEVGEQCYGLKKGDRIYLESARSCGVCYNCKSGKRDLCDDIQIAGKDYDGFLRDFAVCEYTDVTPLPDSLDNMLALCIEMVGIAENIYDKLNLSAGQRVAVIGADCLGNIIAQVLQYHKVIPIVIDNTPSNLESLKKCGIYYTFPADDSVIENVKEATSGNMCDAAIYSSNSRLPISLPSSLIAKKKSLVLSGFTSIHSAVEARDILEKDLTVFGITNAANYTASVINMLLHGAININCFEKEVISQFDPVSLLTERCESLNTSNKSKLTVLKMIF